MAEAKGTGAGVSAHASCGSGLLALVKRDGFHGGTLGAGGRDGALGAGGRAHSQEMDFGSSFFKTKAGVAWLFTSTAAVAVVESASAVASESEWGMVCDFQKRVFMNEKM